MVKFKYTLSTLAVILLCSACMPRLGSSTATDSEYVNPTIPPKNTLAQILDPTSTTQPTSTNIPTLDVKINNQISIEEKQAIVRDLMINNAGCKLPCWWGITPGVTKTVDAIELLSEFSTRIVPIEHSKGVSYIAYFPYPEDLFPQEVPHTYRDVDGIIEEIELFTGRRSQYQISDLLKRHGPPSEVWVSTLNADKMGYVLFSVLMFYPAEGFLVDHEFRNGSIDDSLVHGCPGDDTSPEIFIWDSNLELDIEGALERVQQIPGNLKYKRLESVSEMDILEFSESFRLYDPKICIDTLTDLWPPP